jgi:hypothetical protein
MAEDRFAVERAIDFGRAAVGVAKGGGEAFVGIEFADVGPEVDLAEARLEPAALVPVIPAAAQPVAFGGMPALVAAEDFAVERRGIDAGGGGAGDGDGGGGFMAASRIGPGRTAHHAGQE